VAIVVLCAPAVWNAVQTRIRLDKALRASKTRETLERSLSAIDQLRVWGAGMPIADDKFCPCTIVPRPERVYFETKDPVEIRNFIDLLHARPYWTLDPPVAICGQVTFEFLRDGKRVFWLNLRGQDLPSRSGPIPVTSGTMDDIEAWLKQRSVRERILADLRNPLH
jgi:hypothetical protein